MRLTTPRKQPEADVAGYRESGAAPIHLGWPGHGLGGLQKNLANAGRAVAGGDREFLEPRSAARTKPHGASRGTGQSWAHARRGVRTLSRTRRLPFDQTNRDG